jgi:ferritin-like metal-binding protein YciE
MESEVRELLCEEVKDAYSAEKQALSSTFRIFHPPDRQVIIQKISS